MRAINCIKRISIHHLSIASLYPSSKIFTYFYRLPIGEETFSSTWKLLVTSNWVLFAQLFVNAKAGWLKQQIFWILRESADWYHEATSLMKDMNPIRDSVCALMAVSGLVIWCWLCFCRGRYSVSWEKGFPLGHKWFALILLQWNPTINAIDLVLYASSPGLLLPLLFYAAVNNKTY